MESYDLVPITGIDGWNPLNFLKEKAEVLQNKVISHTPVNSITTKLISFSEAFEKAYKTVKKHEGGYSNVKGDRGGQTYMGIARNISPNEKWEGWKIIDAYIKKNGEPRNNFFIKNAELEMMVKRYYFKNWWLANALDKVNDFDVAEIIFDWCVNSGGNADKGVQTILRDVFKKPIKVDGAIGANTVNAINSINPEQLYEAIKQARIKYYNAIANNGQNKQFLPGWLKRINSFWYKGIVKDTAAKMLTKIGVSNDKADKMAIPVIIGTGVALTVLGVLTYKLIKNATGNK